MDILKTGLGKVSMLYFTDSTVLVLNTGEVVGIYKFAIFQISTEKT